MTSLIRNWTDPDAASFHFKQILAVAVTKNHDIWLAWHEISGAITRTRLPSLSATRWRQ